MLGEIDVEGSVGECAGLNEAHDQVLESCQERQLDCYANAHLRVALHTAVQTCYLLALPIGWCVSDASGLRCSRERI